jgi:hypothetical protein
MLLVYPASPVKKAPTDLYEPIPNPPGFNKTISEVGVVYPAGTKTYPGRDVVYIDFAAKLLVVNDHSSGIPTLCHIIGLPLVVRSREVVK